MGRFYSTNTPQNIDFVYKPPFEMMARALQNADTANDQIYDQAKFLNDDLLKVNFLEKDRQAVMDKQKEYQAMIDEKTKSIADNPLNYRKVQPGLRDLSRGIQRDLSTGQLGTIQRNYQRLTDWDKQQQAGVASGAISASDYNAAKQGFLNQYQGAVDPKTGHYNEIQTENLVNDPKILDKAIKLSNDMKAGLTHVKRDALTGMYIYSNETGTKQVTGANIAEAVQNGLMGDMGVGNYFEQGERLGYRKGGYDKENKNIIPAFTYGANGEMIWHPESPIYNAVRSRMASQAFTETTEGLEIKGDPVKLAQQEMAQRERLARLAASSRGPGGGPEPIDAFNHVLNVMATTPEQALVNTPMIGSPEFIKQQQQLGHTQYGKPISTLDDSLKEIALGSLAKEELAKYTTHTKNADGSITQTVDWQNLPDYYLKLKPSRYKSTTVVEDEHGVTDPAQFKAGEVYTNKYGVTFRYNSATDVTKLEDPTIQIVNKNGDVKGSITRDPFNVQYNYGNKGVNKYIQNQEAQNYRTVGQ